MLNILFLLIAGHYLMDIVLQSEKTGLSKNPRFTPPGYRPEIHGPKAAVWIHELTGHAFSHGLAVYLATQNLYLGLTEVVLHWTIDLFKGKQAYNVHVDQALHLSCKIIYVIILWKISVT